MRHRMLGRIVVASLLVGFGMPSPSPAQDGRNVLEQLFKAFTEIDRARRDRKAEEERARQEELQRQQQVRPGRPVFIDADLRTFRELMSSFAASSTSLSQRIEVLSADPTMRSLLPESYEIRSRASGLMTQSLADSVMSQELTTAYAEMDGAWRALSHQIKQVRGLDGQVRTLSTALDRDSDSLCRLLGIQADYSRMEAVVAAAGAAASIEALVDDVRFELVNQPDCQALVDRGIQAQQQFRQLALLLDGTVYEEAVRQAKASASEWQSFSAQLLGYRSARLLRAVARTQTRVDTMLNSLRVVPDMPYAFIAALAEVGADDAAALMARHGTRLASLLPRGRGRLTVSGDVLASRFLGFADLARSQAAAQELAGQLTGIEGSWSEVRPVIDQLRSADATARAQSIDSHLSRLTSIVGVVAGPSREELLQATAELYQFSVNLDAGIKNQIGLFSDPRVRSAVLQQSAAFSSSVQGMMGSVQTGRTGDRLSGQFGQAMQAWQALSPLLDSAVVIRGGFRGQLAYANYLQSYRQQGDSLMAKVAIMMGG